jgi:endoglucanase
MKFVALAAAAALAGHFYADPDSNAARQADKYDEQGRPEAARLMRSMAAVPQASWFTNGTPKQVRKAVDRTVDAAARAQAVPVLVAYNVPNRDCGGYSAGGAGHYRRWIDGFADGIKGRRAVVILEPDALASGCVELAHLRRAVKRLDRLPDAAVYVDAGHSRWQPAKTMKRRLEKVGARAFALNVSNFRATDELVAYGSGIGMHFVIDTSPNGQGPKGTRWCNPPGRGLGALPTTETYHPLVDAFLWIKTPGESDGGCHGSPPAGRWWPRYALGLARRANPPLG